LNKPLVAKPSENPALHGRFIAERIEGEKRSRSRERRGETRRRSARISA
jgi:hypothetical protein